MMVVRTAQYLFVSFVWILLLITVHIIIRIPLMKELLSGKEEFIFSDLMLPQCDRTKFFLNNLIHYYEFTTERQEFVDQVSNEQVFLISFIFIDCVCNLGRSST